MVKAKFPSKRPFKAAAFTSYLCRQYPTKTDPKRVQKPAQQRIITLQEEIELLTSYSSDTVYRLRYDTMTYDYISPAVTRLLGYTTDEMKRIRFRSLILETKIVKSGMKQVESFEELEENRKSGDASKWQADYLIRTKDNRHIWVSDVSYPWFDEHGNVIGSIGALRDISERVEIENKIREDLARMANTDSLSGLSNRRDFFERLDAELKRVKRSVSDVALMLIDIDHFKQVNDTHGHDVGDKMIVELSRVIQNCLRETDLAARIGGEEFAVMLLDTSADGAYFVAERIRTSVLKHQLILGSDQKPVTCTVSIGVSSTNGTEEMSSSELYKMADTRLYIAKNTGRNQVSVDEILQTH